MKILILGGGFGGMYAAKELRRAMGDEAEIEIISETNYFVFQPLLPEVAGGSITAMHAVSPLRSLLKGVTVRQARIASVDVDARIVTVFQGVQRRPTEVCYDHLVIALGTTVDLSRTPGLADHALTMKTLDDARRVRAHVIDRLEHADITSLPEVKNEALTFCVVGAGFSGVETVGEIAEMIERGIKQYPNIDPSEVRIVVLEFADRCLNELPENLAAYAQKRLEDRGIEVKLRTGVKSVTGTALETTEGELIGTRTIIATIGNAPSPVIAETGLETQHGRIVVDRAMRAKGRDDVWSLGDCALIPMVDNASERDEFAPPTAQFAVREARRLAANVARVAKGEEPEPFVYKSQGALASLGARRGVAEVWGRQFSGFFAWLLWRAYYLSFLPGVRAKATVLMNWIIDGFSRSIVQIKPGASPPVRYVHYRAGDRVFEAGNRADGVYSIIKGAVEVTLPKTENGGPSRHIVRAGDHFGARAIFGDLQRTGTVRAVEDTVVLFLARDEAVMLAAGFPHFQDHLKDHLKERYDIDWRPELVDLKKAS